MCAAHIQRLCVCVCVCCPYTRVVRVCVCPFNRGCVCVMPIYRGCVCVAVGNLKNIAVGNE